MASKRIEFWLKSDGKIEQITDHEAFSAKIKKSGKSFNVAIIAPTSGFFYKTYWNPEALVFEYAPMTVSIAQLRKTLDTAKILIDIS